MLSDSSQVISLIPLFDVPPPPFPMHNQTTTQKKMALRLSQWDFYTSVYFNDISDLFKKSYKLYCKNLKINHTLKLTKPKVTTTQRPSSYLGQTLGMEDVELRIEFYPLNFWPNTLTNTNLQKFREKTTERKGSQDASICLLLCTAPPSALYVLQYSSRASGRELEVEKTHRETDRLTDVLSLVRSPF